MSTVAGAAVPSCAPSDWRSIAAGSSSPEPDLAQDRLHRSDKSVSIRFRMCSVFTAACEFAFFGHAFKHDMGFIGLGPRQ